MPTCEITAYRYCNRLLFILFEQTVGKVPNFTFSPLFIPKHGTIPGSIEVMRMDGEENYRRVVLSNTAEGEMDVGKPVSICVDPVNGLV